MRDLIQLLGPLVFLGGVGLILGVIIGLAVRRWLGVAVLVAAGVLAVGFGLSRIEDDPDDDDPGLAYAIAGLSNLAGWTVGLVGGAAVGRRRRCV
jgi:hypothetical protein